MTHSLESFAQIITLKGEIRKNTGVNPENLFECVSVFVSSLFATVVQTVYTISQHVSSIFNEDGVVFEKFDDIFVEGRSVVRG